MPLCCYGHEALIPCNDDNSTSLCKLRAAGFELDGLPSPPENHGRAWKPILRYNVRHVESPRNSFRSHKVASMKTTSLGLVILMVDSLLTLSAAPATPEDPEKP